MSLLVGLTPNFFSRLWRGQHVDELVLWHDQGYGDAIQNLVWIEAICQRVNRLRLFVRASLMRVVKERMSLPANCQVGCVESGMPTLAAWNCPSRYVVRTVDALVVGGPISHRCSAVLYHAAETQSDYAHSPRIGLVWMAGRHQAPQPELAARLRDLPLFT